MSTQGRTETRQNDGHRASETTLGVRALVAMPDHLSLTEFKAPAWEKERTNSCKVSSDYEHHGMQEPPTHTK